MERGGVQLIGLLYSWQIWFHPWEGWLRRGRKAGTTWQLALPREQVRQTVERRLCAQFLTIWLFVVCNQHSRRKEAVADAITLAGPCHPIIDDVGAGCPGRTDLSDRSEEHTSELQSLMRISDAAFCWQKK